MEAFFVVLATAATLLVVAVGWFTIRLFRSPFPVKVAFWWLVNELYCRWWFRLKHDEFCPIPAEGPVVVVANHTCAIDPLLLIASIPHRKLGFLIAEEYSNVPVFGFLTRMMECIPVKRDGEDIAGTKAALRHLKGGKPLGIFIEGRIAKPGEKIEPKDGAAMLALRTGAVVVPAYISGTTYDDGVAVSFLHRHHAHVRFGPPLNLGEFRHGRIEKEDLGLATTAMMQAILALAPPPLSSPVR
jgi:1-acyl-sn-glycerol-3-phosphate acyltransferase